MRVSNAKIELGSTEGHTDASGLLYLPAAMVGESAYLTVEKDGFFEASRRFYPSPGIAQYLRIILLSDSRIAFFNAQDGAALPVEDKATIHFPPNGYVLENGEMYEGIIVVSAKVIAPDDPDLSFKMPGDLVGVNTNGSFGALGSMGMIAVEMNTPSGEKLNLAGGIEATLEMKIPLAMTDKAPASIPLWSFDEVDGVWREEGVAYRTGDRFVGKVSHFSFWNCDAWFPTVAWGAFFVYEDGSPASQVKVCITIDDLGTSNCAYTDTDGVVKGMVAAKEGLHLGIYGKCGQEIFASDIGPYDNASYYGPISVSDPSAQSHVSGYAVDCELKPLVNGYVKISTGHESYYAVPDGQTGAFGAKVSGCVGGHISVFAFNPDKTSYSKTFSAPFSSKVEVDTLYTCIQNEEFAEFQIDGFSNPVYFDSLEFVRDVDYTSIRAVDVNGNVFGVWFRGISVGSFYATDGTSITGHVDSIHYKSEGPLLIIIDSFGEIGEFVTGRIEGKVTTSEFNYVPEYLLTGSFSVRRE